MFLLEGAGECLHTRPPGSNIWLEQRHETTTVSTRLALQLVIDDVFTLLSF